jgi:hypothetical protein
VEFENLVGALARLAGPNADYRAPSCERVPLWDELHRSDVAAYPPRVKKALPTGRLNGGHPVDPRYSLP